MHSLAHPACSTAHAHEAIAARTIHALAHDARTQTGRSHADPGSRTVRALSKRRRKRCVRTGKTANKAHWHVAHTSAARVCVRASLRTRAALRRGTRSEPTKGGARVVQRSRRRDDEQTTSRHGEPTRQCVALSSTGTRAPPTTLRRAKHSRASARGRGSSTC